MKREPRFWVRQRWWILYHARLTPRSTAEIAKQTGVSQRTARRVISDYNRLGPDALETPGTGGRRHAYLTMEQERTFLASLVARAERGEMTTVRHIGEALPTTCATRWCAASAAESECTGRYQGCWKTLCIPDGSLPPGWNSEKKGGV